MWIYEILKTRLGKIHGGDIGVDSNPAYCRLVTNIYRVLLPRNPKITLLLIFLKLIESESPIV